MTQQLTLLKHPVTPPVTRRHQEHFDYLQRVSQGDNPLIDSLTANLAREAWNTVWKASGYTIDVPSAGTGPDGEMFYSWDKDEHHLELEIIPGKPAEFFYRNRLTNEVWGEDYTIGDPLSSNVVQKLNLVEPNV